MASTVTGAREFAAKLRTTNENIGPAVQATLKKGAVNIKRDWRKDIQRSRHFRQVSSAVNFDQRSFSGFGATVFSMEIGLDKGSPGSLGNVVHFGTSRGGGTVGDPMQYLDREAPELAKHLAQDIVKGF